MLEASDLTFHSALTSLLLEPEMKGGAYLLISVRSQSMTAPTFSAASALTDKVPCDPAMRRTPRRTGRLASECCRATCPIAVAK